MTHAKGDARQRAAVSLLRNVSNRRGIERNPFVESVCRRLPPALAPKGRSDFIDLLPRIITALLDELSGESDHQRRRFDILRKSDVERANHATVAREMGLSRSQFYRDLHEARERFADVLEDRLASRTFGAYDFDERGLTDGRFASIEALRNGGRFEHALQMAITLARESADEAGRVRALCVCAELETELGQFADARSTTKQARALMRRVTDDRLRGLLETSCDLAELELGHCMGVPAAAIDRNRLIDRLRRDYALRDRTYAALLVKGLIEEASILFEGDDTQAARAIIEEASSIVAREHLHGTLEVDVAIRASGIRALRPDQVSAALRESAQIVEMGNRAGDVRTLRVGMQMMSAHLLTLGRLQEARDLALQALALIDLFGSTLDRLIVLSNLARIELHRRDGNQALRWIDMAQALSCDAFSITQALAISRAEALVLIGRPDRAIEMAQTLSDRVQRWPRLLGRAKLAEATALHALDQRENARACSDEAVELSRGAAGPLLHLRALDLNVKLTGNAASKAALRDLQSALNA